MKTPLDPHLFREAMRLTASGVTVVTTAGASGRAGVTVSSMSSLSMAPPSVIVCIHRDNYALPLIVANGVFAANVLADGQERVADAFAGLVPELRDDRFAVAQWQTLVTGAPALEWALCSFDCSVAKVFEFGTHMILAGEVLELTTFNAAPLIFSGRGYRKLAQPGT